MSTLDHPYYYQYCLKSTFTGSYFGLLISHLPINRHLTTSVISRDFQSQSISLDNSTDLLAFLV